MLEIPDKFEIKYKEKRFNIWKVDSGISLSNVYPNDNLPEQLKSYAEVGYVDEDGSGELDWFSVNSATEEIEQKKKKLKFNKYKDDFTSGFDIGKNSGIKGGVMEVSSFINVIRDICDQEYHRSTDIIFKFVDKDMLWSSYYPKKAKLGVFCTDNHDLSIIAEKMLTQKWEDNHGSYGVTGKRYGEIEIISAGTRVDQILRLGSNYETRRETISVAKDLGLFSEDQLGEVNSIINYPHGKENEENRYFYAMSLQYLRSISATARTLKIEKSGYSRGIKTFKQAKYLPHMDVVLGMNESVVKDLKQIFHENETVIDTFQSFSEAKEAVPPLVKSGRFNHSNIADYFWDNSEKVLEKTFEIAYKNKIGK